MKTKDFIKMLQEADPSGESHIRMSGGVPYVAIKIPGYYDGTYQYIDDDDNFVYSSQNSKVDIYQLNQYDYINKLIEENRNITLDEVLNKFIFDYGNYANSVMNDKIEKIRKSIESDYNDIKEVDDRLYNEVLSESLVNQEKGWKWFTIRNHDGNIDVYKSIVIDENNQLEYSNFRNFEAIIYESDKWTETDLNDDDVTYLLSVTKLSKEDAQKYKKWVFNNK